MKYVTQSAVQQSTLNAWTGVTAVSPDNGKNRDRGNALKLTSDFAGCRFTRWPYGSQCNGRFKMFDNHMFSIIIIVKLPWFNALENTECSNISMKLLFSFAAIVVSCSILKALKNKKACFLTKGCSLTHEQSAKPTPISLTHDTLPKNKNNHNYNTRNRHKYQFIKHKKEIFKNKPSYIGIHFFNRLPYYVKN
jgi:hypothetical protein